jgi:hypothetical protein
MFFVAKMEKIGSHCPVEKSSNGLGSGQRLDLPEYAGNLKTD